jgi:hypothetical protein
LNTVEVDVHGSQGDQIERIFIGQLFTLGSFLKMTEVCSPCFGATFFLGLSHALILPKNVLGYILSDFFTNSSCHPDGSRVTTCANSWTQT